MALEVVEQAKVLRVAELLTEAIRVLSEVDHEIQTEPDGMTPLDPVGILLSSVIKLTVRVAAGESLPDLEITEIDPAEMPEGTSNGQIIKLPLG